MDAFLTWLMEGAIGPAGIGLPVTWAGSKLASASARWFRRLRGSDDLSRIVRVAAGDDVDLSREEFAAVRGLLEQESTWAGLGRGTVEDIAVTIAQCLQGEGREESLRAGRAIAAGLLESAARDLKPEWFQQVLFARLERLETRQARALDEAMADLAVLLASRETDDSRLRQITGQLGLVLDRLPPGLAGRQEVMVYLAALIRWLNSDSWPQDSQWTRQVLTPADIERRLSITDSGGDERDLDADELGRECSRLVVLGGPGSGKTWLAKRTARRCAEEALARLADGAGPGEVELPLYTTCARLAAAPLTDRIRHAVVASALSQMPDLGGTRTTDALQVLFEERNTATLLVLDSLDEARRAADDRVRKADMLPAAWRIMLTSRPGSWNRQLAIRAGDPLTRAGDLQPLNYPDDVEPFVQAWFRGQPGRAATLTAQFGDRPDLQEAVTVPLLLTFCCIIGGDKPLPGRRADLYEKVIRRMLTGQWRGSGRDPEYDLDACLETLCEWARSAAGKDPVSGVGDWEDEFPTPWVADRDNREALDHVAVPLGQPDPETLISRRRFVHRSVHEHLAARYVSRMPAGDAAGALLGHLWYDPDWEYAAPAALVMHPDREEVLRELIGQVTGGDQSAAGLTAADGCWEVRRFLAQVAHESSQDDWSLEAAGLIGQARTELIVSRQVRTSIPADGWPASDRQILKYLLTSTDMDWAAAEGLAETVAELGAESEERAPARLALLKLLTSTSIIRLEGDGNVAVPAWMTDVVAAGWAVAIHGVDRTAEEQASARKALLGLLASTDDNMMAVRLANAVAELDPTVTDLGNSHTWPCPPTATLLAAARRNSELRDWLAALPTLRLSQIARRQWLITNDLRLDHRLAVGHIRRS